MPALLASSTVGWPEDVYDPALAREYDKWTHTLPPWLLKEPSQDGLIHFPTGLPAPMPQEALFLPRSSMPEYLNPRIAYWLDLVNHRPSYWEFSFRLLHEASGRIVQVHPSDLFLAKMGDDKCDHCNKQSTSVRCFIAAWTPPNAETGQYPRLSATTGEEETILHRGCLACAVAGKKCSKMGQQLYPFTLAKKVCHSISFGNNGIPESDIGRKGYKLMTEKRTMDGQPLEPLDIRDIYKVPEGYRILVDEPKKARTSASSRAPSSNPSTPAAGTPASSEVLIITPLALTSDTAPNTASSGASVASHVLDVSPTEARGTKRVASVSSEARPADAHGKRKKQVTKKTENSASLPTPPPSAKIFEVSAASDIGDTHQSPIGQRPTTPARSTKSTDAAAQGTSNGTNEYKGRYSRLLSVTPPAELSRPGATSHTSSPITISDRFHDSIMQIKHFREAIDVLRNRQEIQLDRLKAETDGIKAELQELKASLERERDASMDLRARNRRLEAQVRMYEKESERRRAQEPARDWRQAFAEVQAGVALAGDEVQGETHAIENGPPAGVSEMSVDDSSEVSSGINSST